MTSWRVAGVLALIAIEAFLYGYTYPFFSLALERQGLPTWLIGLNASLAGAGIFLVGPFLPRLIDRLGVKAVVIGQFAISLASFLVLLLGEDVLLWFAARFVMGTCFATMWTTTEIWLNGVVDDKSRGRVIGASGTLYAAFQFLGPLALGQTGVSGSIPLYAAIVPLGVGLLIAFLIVSRRGEVEEEDVGDLKGFKLAIHLAGSLIALAFLAGVGETALQSLLPVYGLAHELNEANSAYLVSVFSLGEAVLVAALGVMADRWGRNRTFGLCVALSIATMLSLPLVMQSEIGRMAALFLAGGVISGLYTLGVILIGFDFKGSRLAVVSTGFAMSYSAGSVIGATFVGGAMDLFGAEALPLLIAASFAVMGVAMIRRSHTHSATA